MTVAIIEMGLLDARLHPLLILVLVSISLQTEVICDVRRFR